MIQAEQTERTPPASAEFLDLERVQVVLRERAGIEWPAGVLPEQVRIERVWPVKDRGLACEWSFRWGKSGRSSLFATPAHSSAPSPLAEARQPFVSSGILQGIRIAMPELGVILHSPDQDAALPRLPDCLDGSAMGDRLVPFQPGGAQLPRGGYVANLLSYRAGRRATFLYRPTTKEGEPLAAKTFRDDRGERLLALHAKLADALARRSGGRIRVPAPMGYLPDLRLAVFSWCGQGRRLPRARPSSPDLQAAMGMLAVLHGTTLEDAPLFGADDELRILERWRAALAHCGVGATIPDALLDALRAAVVAPHTPPTVVHRDFYGRQFLLHDRDGTLVDLDTLAQGDPAIDVGNFLAHLWLESRPRSTGNGVARFESDARRAIRGYVEEGGRVEAESLRWYWASALVRLGAVHALRTSTRAAVPALWGLAARLLGGSSPVKADPERILSEAGR